MTGTYFRRRQHAMLRKVAAFLLAFATSLAAADPAPLPSQSAESSEAHTTAGTRPGSPGAASPRPQPVAMPGSSVSDATAEVEDLRRFNELRREILDHRAKTVDWWLAATGIFLTLLGIVAVIAGYISFKRFHKIEAEARGYVELSGRHAEEARDLVVEIKARRDEAESLLKGFTAEAVHKEPAEAGRAAESVQGDPTASPIDQAVAAAVLLQQRGNIEESIEKWRAVAVITEGIDKDLSARAWFSVGYLCQVYDKGPLETAIGAYDKAILLKPDYTVAYNNRGIAKGGLGLYEEAIADHNEAIGLKPDLAEAYINRGNTKRGFGRHEEAITDYDRAIQLKPDLAEAYNNRGAAKRALDRPESDIADYDEAIRLKPDFTEAYINRGRANFSLNRMDEARRDFETAITLARNARDEPLVRDAERAIKELRGGQAP